MNGFGLPDLIGFCVFGVIVLVAAFCSRNTRVIVLTSKTINPQGPLLVRLEGRRSGFISWLMKLCRLQTTLSYSFFKDRIELGADSFFGQETHFVLVKNVSAMEVSYACMFNLLVASIFFFVLGGVAYSAMGSLLVFLAFLALSIFAFVRYTQSKRYKIQVFSPGFSFCIVFQKNLMEGESLSMSDLEAIRQIFRYLTNPENKEINLEEAHASVVRRQPVQSAQPFQPTSSVSQDQPGQPFSPVPPRPVPPRNVPSRNVPPQDPTQFH